MVPFSAALPQFDDKEMSIGIHSDWTVSDSTAIDSLIDSNKF